MCLGMAVKQKGTRQKVATSRTVGKPQERKVPQYLIPVDRIRLSGQVSLCSLLLTLQVTTKVVSAANVPAWILENGSEPP